MSSLSRRRSVVVVVTLACVLAAATAIRLAADWTVSAAPLTERPPDAAELVANLQQERARADALSVELEQVVTQSDELRAALLAAQGKAGKDAETAAELAEQLATARARLASLEAKFATAAAQPATITVTEQSAAAAGEGHEDDEHEDEPDEEDGA